MARYLEEDEVKQELLDAMGPDLAPVFHELVNELVVIHDDWREYSELFGTSPERIELLARAANRFFGVLQQTLFENTLLHLARLTSKKKSAGHDVLTIQRLPDLIPDEDLRKAVQHDVDEAIAKTAFAMDWRHNYLAHRSLPIALSDDLTGKLAPASRGHVEDGLKALATVLNRIHEHYVHSELSFDIVGGPGDALDLLRVLQDGVKAHDAREKRFESGKLLTEDLQLPDRL